MPYFTVIDSEAVSQLIGKFTSATRREDKCLYYGWTANGNDLHCQESYTSAVGVKRHLENVKPLLSQLLDGPATLKRLELHAPASQVIELKELLDPLGAVYFVSNGGFQNWTAPESENRVRNIKDVVRAVEGLPAKVPVRSELIRGEYGREYTPTERSVAPIVTFSEKRPGTKYTGIMTDPDAPNRKGHALSSFIGFARTFAVTLRTTSCPYVVWATLQLWIAQVRLHVV